VQIFGDPQERVVSFRFEGHHCSVNVTIVDDAIRATPLFRATNPSHVPNDDARAAWCVLDREEATGHAWLAVCTPAEQQAAILAGEVPLDTMTRTAALLSVEDLPRGGIAVEGLSETAHRAVTAAMDAWLEHLAPELAEGLRQRNDLVAGKGLSAVWMGAAVQGAPHYWRIANERFLIEFAMGQNNGNHIHAVMREVHGDFAADCL
jgi:hypothetical protein